MAYKTADGESVYLAEVEKGQETTGNRDKDNAISRKKVKWSVLIAGIGVHVVEAEDIDGAHAAAMTAYGCRIEDILAVFGHSPVRTS